jgi:hypothetical protein
MGLDNLFGDGQPQPQSGKLLTVLLYPVIRLKEAALLLGWNADAFIPDIHAQVAVLNARMQIDGPLLRAELAGIRKEIDDNLFQPRWVYFSPGEFRLQIDY